MTKDSKGLEDMKFDLRVLKQRLRRGEVDQKEYEAYLKKLPNDESNAEYIEVFEEVTIEEKTPHIEELTFTSA